MDEQGTDTSPPSIGALYLAAHGSFVEFASSLNSPDWAAPVACTPGWTVRDVLSHVAGVPDDAFAGRLDGVATATWTGAQVTRNRELPVDVLIERWATQAPRFAEMIDAMGENRPPFDCHTHEHDIRHALGRSGNRDSAVVETGGFSLAELDVPGGVCVTVELDDGRRVVNVDPRGGRRGDADVEVVLHDMGTFELFRSRIGRRSREQVFAYAWQGPDDAVAAVIDRWFVFGPAASPIVE